MKIDYNKIKAKKLPGTRIIDLSGERFGQLLVLGYAGPTQWHEATWLCRCECGTEKIVSARALRSGATTSCGCYQKERVTECAITHGLSKTSEYNSWESMKTRCLSKSYRDYHNYGGRGIRICPQWIASFEVFLSDMGPCPSGHSLDRIDVNGDYTPENCRWATPKQQSNNRRDNRRIKYNGQEKTLCQWARKFGINPVTLRSRLNRGWSVHESLTKGVQKRCA